MIGVAVLAFTAPARSAVSSLHLPLTPREQPARLWLLATRKRRKGCFRLGLPSPGSILKPLSTRIWQRAAL